VVKDSGKKSCSFSTLLTESSFPARAPAIEIHERPM
jgi:hypothetical protein